MELAKLLRVRRRDPARVHSRPWLRAIVIVGLVAVLAEVGIRVADGFSFQGVLPSITR